jgi:serine/threonine protein kinase
MSALHSGDLLDHYRIENLVARSGMASIYRATDVRTGQPVAIKIPHPEMEADVASSASRRLARSSTTPMS